MDDIHERVAAAGVMVAIFVAAVAGMVGIDRRFPPDGSGIESLRTLSSVRQWLHSVATLSLGIGCLIAVDLVLLPWLDIHHAVSGKGEWSRIALPMRCVAVGGWFVLASAILLSMTQGVIAL